MFYVSCFHRLFLSKPTFNKKVFTYFSTTTNNQNKKSKKDKMKTNLIFGNNMVQRQRSHPELRQDAKSIVLLEAWRFKQMQDNMYCTLVLKRNHCDQPRPWAWGWG